MNKAMAIFVAILLLLIPGQLNAQVYKWVDENGVAHYSDTPQPGTAAGEGAASANATGPQSRKKDRSQSPLFQPKVNFEISGVVKDAKGNLLSGVTMTILEHHFPPNSYEFKEVRKKRMVNGRFHISCSDCPIHALYFRAPGFLSEKITIKVSDAQKYEIMERAAAVMAGKKDPGGDAPITIRENGIVVVLQSKASIVRLIRIHAQLFTGEQGPLNVLSGSPPRLKDTNYGHNQTQTNHRNPNAMVALDIGETLFSSLAKAGRANTFHTLDTPLLLDLKGIEGGFIQATPTVSQFRKKFDELHEAPASGYRRQLEIRPSETDGVFFYCKIGDYYGKGYIVRPTFEWVRGNGLVRTDVEIYLNPATGNHNLKSRF